jgi:site-specific DNA recombinase
MEQSKIRRCAIYTRKSSEEGLQQDFNSLHAQREACEAFILSQRGEGWRLIKTAYDDGGLSGASMERPSLQRLLADVNAGHVDVIVVYKVDRLTRSLADFAKMVEVFDGHGVSFVAVTQQFNTTTSMGRLTLNVLLSFAQFEREVTGERIRDKIAASKRKGMWMGGFVPFGYEKRNHKLVVNDAEAATVRLIFQRYLELRSVRLLKQDLDQRALLSKVRVGKNGLRMGGKAFSRGKLYKLLSSPTYVGEIRHHRACHPGLHHPIVDRVLWDRVQQVLGENAARQRNRASKADPSPLAGKLFDESGLSLTPAHTVKNRHRYRYYVSRELHRGDSRSSSGWRVPAIEIERTIAAAMKTLLNNRVAVVKATENSGLEAHQIMPIIDQARAWSLRLQPGSDMGDALGNLVERAELKKEGIELSIRFSVTLSSSATAETREIVLRHFEPIKIQRRGVEMRLVIDNEKTNSKVDAVLLKTVARAHRWFDDLVSGKEISLAAIARHEKVSVRYVGRGIRLAFLSPAVVEAIAEGRQPAKLSAETLLKHSRLPSAWTEQSRILHIE